MAKTSRYKTILAAGAAVALALSATPAIAQQRNFDLPAQSATRSIPEFGRQAGIQIIAPGEILRRVRTPALRGTYDVRAALRTLLANSGLRVVSDDGRTITLGAMAAPGSGEAQAAGAAAENEGVLASVPEILVTGRRLSLNADIPRTRNDAQPYVVFSTEDIERADVSNVEEFLLRRLPMNTVGRTNSQQGTTNGSSSSVNLRGLGTNQTLILVDGRRLATASAFGGTPAQPDINAIPLQAIERIEILPATASGIYGGGATGGVVNIIRRRQLSGLDLRMRYENTFETDAPNYRIDLGGGFSPWAGGNVLFAASYADSEPLLQGDRPFLREGRLRLLQNNPSFYLASAIPPLGSTPNIRSVSGASLYGPGTPNFGHIPVGYAGGGIAALLAGAGQYNFELPNSAQSDGARRSLVNSPRTYSATLTLRQSFSPDWSAFADLTYSRNRGRFAASAAATATQSSFEVAANAPNNPFGQAIRVTVPIDSVDRPVEVNYTDRRLVLGVIGSIGREWRVAVDYVHDRFATDWAASTSTPFFSAALAPAIRNGSFDVLRDPALFPTDFRPYLLDPTRLLDPQVSTLQTMTARAAGPIGSLPAGRPTLSMLVERRTESYDDTTQFDSPTSFIYYPARSQTVDSAYAELNVPLLASGRAETLRSVLEVQAALRYDRYDINGRTGFIQNATTPVIDSFASTESWSPTVALRFEPVPGIIARAGYARGFLPPDVNQLVKGPPLAISQLPVIDPKRNNETTTSYQFTTGGNPDLQPERSETWAAGIILQPALIPGLRLSADYVRILKRDNITRLNQQQVVDNEDLFPGRVTRGPSTSGAGPIQLIDVSLLNASTARIEALDFAVDYSRDFGRLGQLSIFAAGTWQIAFKTQLVPTVDVRELVGKGSVNPVAWRANAGVNWRVGAVTFGWAGRFIDSYLVANPLDTTSAAVIRNQGGLRIPSQTYHDVYVTFDFEPRQGNELRLQLGIGNVFDSRPPFDVGALAGAQLYYSPFGDPRGRVFRLSLGASF